MDVPPPFAPLVGVEVPTGQVITAVIIMITR